MGKKKNTDIEALAKVYVENGGTKCPFCGHWNISGDEVTTGNGEASQEMFCGKCGNEWLDIYKLTSIQVG